MNSRDSQTSMTRDEAFDLLQKDQGRELFMRCFAETRRSWIFIIMSASGEPFVGAPPFVVDKRTGRVFMSGDAFLEIAENLNWWQKILRWWCRRYVYLSAP